MEKLAGVRGSIEQDRTGGKSERELANATLHAIHRDGAQIRFVANEHKEVELGSGGERSSVATERSCINTPLATRQSQSQAN